MAKKNSQVHVETHKDVAAVLAAIGIRVTKERRDEIHAECPKHQERLGKPDRSRDSWSINRVTGIHGCWSCGYSGRIESLVVDITEMSYWETLTWLRKKGWQYVASDVTDDDTPEPLPNISTVSVDEMWEAMVDVPPREAKRRNLDPVVLQRYDVRWSTEHNGWAIPIKNWAGRLYGFQVKAQYYLNVPDGVEKSKTLFGIDTFPVGERAILVESPLDVVRLACAGFETGLASFGVEVSGEQLDLIANYTDSMICALDWDLPGQAQAWKVHAAMQRRVDLRFYNYKKTKKRENGKRPKDPGDMTDDEIMLCIAHAKVFAAAGPLLGRRPEKEKKRVRGTATRDGNQVARRDPSGSSRTAGRRTR